MARTFRQKLLVTLMASVMSAALSAPAYSDAQSPERPGYGQGAMQTTPGKGEEFAARQNAAGPAEVLRDMRVSEIIGMNVQTRQGENLGKIQDLAIDVENEEILYVLLSRDDPKGTGEMFFASPFKAFSPTREGLVFDMRIQLAEAAPGMPVSGWPDWNAADYREKVDRYFGEGLAGRTDTAVDLISARRLLGKDLLDPDTRRVGEIEDLVASVNSGRVLYAAVHLQRHPDLRDKLVVVPLKTLQVRHGEEDRALFIWDASPARLSAAPTLDRNTWPNFDDPQYQADIEQYLRSLEPGHQAAGGIREQEAIAALQQRGPMTQSEASPDAAAQHSAGALHGQEMGAGQQVMRDVRATRLLGMEVRNSEGERLGEIRDVVLDIDNQQVHYIVLSHGDTVSSEKLFIYPFEAFDAAKESETLVLDLSRERLEKAPGVDMSQWPEWNDPAYQADVDRHFGEERRATSGSGARLTSVRELLDKDVTGRTGRHLGDIEDIVVNIDDGRIHYVAMEFARNRELSGKLLPLPLEAFDLPARQGDPLDVELKADASQLDISLAFNKDAWPNINDPQYRAEVEQYLVTVIKVEPQGATVGGMGQPEGAGASAAGSSGQTAR